NIVKDLKKIIT
ncbi:Late transcription factor VLTF-4 (1), partial [Monkeypox virus]